MAIFTKEVFLLNDPTNFSSRCVALSGGGNCTITNFQSSRISTGCFRPGTGNHKVAIGYKASYTNSGTGQTAIGAYVLSGNSGSNNTAVGHLSMGICSGAGSGNTAFGSYSLARVTSGNNNVSIGFKNMWCLTSGVRNISIGACAAVGVTTLNNSITIGYNANTGGSNGVALGACSCAETYGSTAIGVKSCANGTDALAIGYNVYAPPATVYWGNSYNNVYNCVWSAWSYFSDERDKTDIVDLNEQLGINLIRKLRPVKYKSDPRDTYVRKCGFEFGQKDGTLALEKESYGLISQEVKQAADELEVNFEAAKISDLTGQYKLSYSDFIPVLVKTIQQIDDRINQIKNKLEENASI
jgi:trimeric autotransporter adhesin